MLQLLIIQFGSHICVAGINSKHNICRIIARIGKECYMYTDKESPWEVIGGLPNFYPDKRPTSVLVEVENIPSTVQELLTIIPEMFL